MNRTRITVVNPFNGNGGANEIQSQFLTVLSMAVPDAIVEVAEIAPELRQISALVFVRKVVKSLSDLLEETDLLILQGIFDPSSIAIGNYARTVGVPYVVIPRGNHVPTLFEWPHTKSALPKWIIWRYFARELVAQAASLITTSHLELSRLKAVGARTDHALVIADPFESQTLTHAKEIPPQGNDWRCPDNPPTALYLGRFSTEKNLGFLIRLWRSVVQKVPEARLVLAGPVDHESVLDDVKYVIRRDCLEKSVAILPWINGEEKIWHLTEARCLVLPSFNESFGLTVPEAIHYGTPCIVSDGTPWADLPTRAGHCLPLRKNLWSEKLIYYLVSAEKKIVPRETMHMVLSPISPQVIALKWRAIINIILAGCNDEAQRA